MGTILIVFTIVSIATSTPSQAQFLKRMFDGDTDNRQPNPKSPAKPVDPRLAAQSKTPGPNASRGNVDPKQLASKQSDSRQNANPPVASSLPHQRAYAPGINGRPPQQPTSQRPQPKSNAQANRPQLPNTQPNNQAAQRSHPSRPMPAATGSNASRYQSPNSQKSNIKSPGANQNGVQSSRNFAESPLAQPKSDATLKYSLLEDDKKRYSQSVAKSDFDSRNVVSKEPFEPKVESNAPSAAPTAPVNENVVLGRFGLNLVEESETVFISQIDAQGNATQAGLQRGDKIVSLGGAPVANSKEFAEIGGMLNDGDQIELIYSRDGKEEKSLIQYGTPIEPSAAGNLDNVSLTLGDSNWSTTPVNETEQLQQLVAQQRQVIAELQKRVRELEDKTSF